MGLIYLISALLISQAQASFSKGTNFEFTNLSGQLTIQCPQSSIRTSCRDTHMEPWPYDIYIGPQIPGATQVELQAIVDESSEVRRVAVSYDGRLGRSKEINLGVSSLFQKPLLRLGKNNILVSIKERGSRVVSESSFEILVKRGQPRSCQPREIKSNNDSDCNSPYSSCQQYFVDQKYCR